MKIRIEGNGNQAPYGIGEIIAVIPAGHIKKIHKLISEWYTAPDMFCNTCGAEVEFDWYFNGKTEVLNGFTECDCRK
jgi:hypothetical protein